MVCKFSAPLSLSHICSWGTVFYSHGYLLLPNNFWIFFSSQISPKFQIFSTAYIVLSMPLSRTRSSYMSSQLSSTFTIHIIQKPRSLPASLTSHTPGLSVWFTEYLLNLPPFLSPILGSGHHSCLPFTPVVISFSLDGQGGLSKHKLITSLAYLKPFYVDHCCCQTKVCLHHMAFEGPACLLHFFLLLFLSTPPTTNLQLRAL